MQHERPRGREHGHDDEDAHRDARAGQPVPVAHAEEELVRERARLLDAELAEDDVEEAARVVEPRRPGRTEVRQELVDHAGRRKEEEEEDRDRDRARDRREVERRPEEPDALHAPVDEDGQEERNRSLDRNDQDDVVEVVAQRRAEVVLIEPGRRQQVAVVLEADEVRVRAERAAVAVPVGDAHPGRHGDRHHEEHAEDDDHRREEQPARRRLMTADPGLPPPPPTACRDARRHFSPPFLVRWTVGRRPPAANRRRRASPVRRSGPSYFRIDCSSPLTRFRIGFGSDCGSPCSCWLKSPSTVAMSGTVGMLVE